MAQASVRQPSSSPRFSVSEAKQYGPEERASQLMSVSTWTNVPKHDYLGRLGYIARDILPKPVVFATTSMNSPCEIPLSSPLFARPQAPEGRKKQLCQPWLALSAGPTKCEVLGTLRGFIPSFDVSFVFSMSSLVGLWLISSFSLFPSMIDSLFLSLLSLLLHFQSRVLFCFSLLFSVF